jgi:hypothetical protein
MVFHVAFDFYRDVSRNYHRPCSSVVYHSLLIHYSSFIVHRSSFVGRRPSAVGRQQQNHRPLKEDRRTPAGNDHDLTSASAFLDFPQNFEKKGATQVL